MMEWCSVDKKRLKGTIYSFNCEPSPPPPRNSLTSSIKHIDTHKPVHLGQTSEMLIPFVLSGLIRGSSPRVSALGGYNTQTWCWKA